MRDEMIEAFGHDGVYFSQLAAELARVIYGLEWPGNGEIEIRIETYHQRPTVFVYLHQTDEHGVRYTVSRAVTHTEAMRLNLPR